MDCAKLCHLTHKRVWSLPDDEQKGEEIRVSRRRVKKRGAKLNLYFVIPSHLVILTYPAYILKPCPNGVKSSNPYRVFADSLRYLGYRCLTLTSWQKGQLHTSGMS